MFDLFSWSHILILLAVALVVVGPKDLPKLMHMAGKWAGKARGLASEFRKSFDDMARQTELDELRQEIEALRTNPTVTGIDASINQPIETGLGNAFAAGPEPRAGELKITDAPPAPVMETSAATEPAAAPPEPSRQ